MWNDVLTDSADTAAFVSSQTLANFPKRSFQISRHYNKHRAKHRVRLNQLKNFAGWPGGENVGIFPVSAAGRDYEVFWVDGAASLDTVHTFSPAQWDKQNILFMRILQIVILKW